MQEDWVIELINVVDGKDVTNFPAVLPVLRLVTGAVSSLPSRAAVETKILRKQRLLRNWWLSVLL